MNTGHHELVENSIVKKAGETTVPVHGRNHNQL